MPINLLVHMYVAGYKGGTSACRPPSSPVPLINASPPHPLLCCPWVIETFTLIFIFMFRDSIQCSIAIFGVIINFYYETSQAKKL